MYRKLSYFVIADIIDPIKDSVSSSDYCEEEDPLLYKSQRTGRGPMKEDWLEHYQVDKPPSNVMCAYKLIKVEFRYWGMQVTEKMFYKAFTLCFTITMYKSQDSRLKVANFKL